ncbi:hypothetical protein PHMEG_00039269 [Phytophthora megakarya]|uniref:RNase H type-1 domain-containing protein n=1 Tax=Phytophthora megakarya TaxID=4795 RepID=A0A225UFD4_9STRA|nr:hypothetical protein PHMEG_00039269 [Phytophthora megakarya]
MITSCSEKKIRVYTRYSVLAWLFKSKTVDGRCLKWAVNLSPWDLDIRRVENDEDGLAAILGAGITPRERLDEVAETLVPEKGSRIKTPPVSLEMLSSDHIGHLLSFDGAAKRDGSGGAACILWSLPSWEIAAATGHFLEKATVNEAEYSGLVKGMQLALDMGVRELVVVGDSRLAIQQLQGVIGCTQPHLLRLLQEAEELQARFKSLRLVHVKRDFNAAADYISKRVIQDQSSLESKQDKATEEQVPGNGANDSGANDSGINELGTDGPGTNDPGTNESGTDGLEDEPTAASRIPDCQHPEEDPEDRPW